MVKNPRTWPIGLHRLADVIGPAAAVKLADVFSGAEDRYIPKKAKIDHPFVTIIDFDRMKLLCEEFGGKKIERGCTS